MHQEYGLSHKIKKISIFSIFHKFIFIAM